MSRAADKTCSASKHRQQVDKYALLELPCWSSMPFMQVFAMIAGDIGVMLSDNSLTMLQVINKQDALGQLQACKRDGHSTRLVLCNAVFDLCI